MAKQRPADLDTQLRDIRRQMNDQLASLDLRMDAKISLLNEFQEFFRRRGEVEYEYARNLERLCERFEKTTKQRNIRNEVRSTFNLWSTLLAETRKLSRERASLAEGMASEMVARLEIMAKDVLVLTKKCRDICTEAQENFLKELRDLGEQTKVYHHSCYNANEAYNKLMKCRDKVETARNSTARRKKAVEKELEKERQYKAQRHLVMKNRNELLLAITKCNAFSMQYFNMDIMDIIEYMDFDYHMSFQRLATAYKEAEADASEGVMACARSIVDQAKGLNFENDLHYFLSENPGPFTPPNAFSFTPYEGDDVSEYKVNTQDVFERAQKSVDTLQFNIQTLEIQREEDVKTVQHMEQVNLKKFQVTTVDDALAVLEEAGEPLSLDAPGGSSRTTASLDRGLNYNTRGGQAITLSQRGKKDSIYFTLGVLQRRITRSDRLVLAHAQLDILEKSLDQQKVPPVPVGVDSRGQSIPGEVPRLFGGDVVEYIKATGCEIPLIVSSCLRAIDKEGLNMEGLFRVPGPAAYTEELRRAFEEGRDPLLYVDKKVDIAAVASVLKGYFRELSTPLFPTDKYRAFIKCTRQEDVSGRLKMLQDTLVQVHPSVVKVMRYLFRFLYKVSQHMSENKMNSANLALVFGPTLTRAPDDMDPRQLHNDVPAVNMLIQLCIDHHLQIFGEDEEEAGMAMAPPPSSPPHDSPVWPEEGVTSPPLPPKTSQDQSVEPTSPLMSPPPVPSTTTSSPPPYLPSSPSHLPTSPSPPQDRVSPPPPYPSQEVEPPPTLDKAAEPDPQLKESPPDPKIRDEWSALDEQVKDLQASLQEINEVVEVKGVESEVKGQKVEGKGGEKRGGHGSESDSDSEEEEEEEEEEEGFSVSARALYDYKARSDKELTFKRGETLKVIEKSPDGHWWDGLRGSQRGFIPVSYVEIIELQTATPTAIPPPPVRKSSMHEEEMAAAEATVGGKVSETPAQAIITEVVEEAPPTGEVHRSPELPRVTVDPEPEPVERKGDSTSRSREGSPVAQPLDKSKEEAPVASKPPVPVTSGQVKSLAQQFTPQVLVKPRHTDLSPRRSYDTPSSPSAGTDPEPINRSSSTSSTSGGRVTHLTSQLANMRPQGPPPPIKPRPPANMVPAGGERTAAPFHITPHASTTGSPLQQAQLGSQLNAPSRATSSKPSRSSKRAKNERPSLPSKPAKPATPSKPSELQAELQAVMGKRRPADK